MRLRTFEVVPSSRVPSTAHHIQLIRRVHFPDCLTALDTTPGERCFWSEAVETDLAVTFSDADIRRLPYADLVYDLGTVDLPHLTDLGKNSILRKRYGTLKNKDHEPLVRAGVAETWRVCRHVLVKVTDHCHGARYVDESSWVQETLGRPYARCFAVHTPIGARRERNSARIATAVRTCCSAAARRPTKPVGGRRKRLWHEPARSHP